MTTPIGPERPNWKGTAASYKTIHSWINRHYPRVGRCEYCGRTDKPTEYAQADHNRPSLNRADWFEFCRSCHRRFDGSYERTPEMRAATGNQSRGRRLSAEARAKVSANRKGKGTAPKSAEHRAKLSAAAKRRKRNAAGSFVGAAE